MISSERKIIITRGIRVSTTIGAFLYAYYIQFNGESSYSYTFHASEEGMMQAVQAWDEADYTIKWRENVTG